MRGLDDERKERRVDNCCDVSWFDGKNERRELRVEKGARLQKDDVIMSDIKTVKFGDVGDIRPLNVGRVPGGKGRLRRVRVECS
jgi:hypothetical protein